MLLNNRLLRNFSALAVAELVVKVIGFATLVYLSRTIGVEGFGKINLAQAIVSYFLLFCNLGFDTYGIREVARQKIALDVLVNNIFTIQFVSAVVSYAVLLLVVLVMPKPGEIKLMTALFGLNLFIFSITIDWFFLGGQKMVVVAVSKIVRSVICAGLIFLTIKDSLDINYFPIIDVVSKSALALYILFSYRRLGNRLRFQFDLTLWKEMAKDALPIGITLVMALVYYNLDTVLLGFIKGEKEVGWYSAAYRVVDTLIIIPGLLVRTVFPLLASTTDDRDRMISNSLSFIRLMFNVGVPIGFGGYLFAPKVISLLYGAQYDSAVLPLQILCWNVVLIFMNTSFNRILIAANKNKSVMKGVMYAAVLNVIMELALIPSYGLNGAAFATLCTEFFVLVYSYIALKETVPVNLLRVAYKPIIAGASVFVVISQATSLLLGGSTWPLPVYIIPVYLILYGALLHLMKETRFSFT